MLRNKREDHLKAREIVLQVLTRGGGGVAKNIFLTKQTLITSVHFQCSVVSYSSAELLYLLILSFLLTLMELVFINVAKLIWEYYG